MRRENRMPRHACMPGLEVGKEGAGSCPHLSHARQRAGLPSSTISFIRVAMDTEPRANAVQLTQPARLRAEC